jgi:ABC-type transport system substrate-binding protein
MVVERGGHQLTFKLRQGVKWHDGKPFAARDLASSAGDFDRYAVGIPSISLMKQIKNQAPQAICEMVPWNIPRTLTFNRAAPPSTMPICGGRWH